MKDAEPTGMETREPTPSHATPKREPAASARPRGIRRILVAVDETERVGRAICKAAKALPGALVVVGAQQVGRLRSLVAVAPHVIRHCARPVLVVRVPEPTPS